MINCFYLLDVEENAMKKRRIAALALLLMLLPLAAFGESTVVTVTCTGDFLPGSNDKIKKETYAFQQYIEKNGYAYPFANLQTLMAQDDITFVNLECPLNDSEPDSKSDLCFRGPTDYAAILPASSIEVVNLANNHMGNYGQAGYDSTVAALDNAGVKYCGTIEQGNSACYVDVKGVRIGFVGAYPLWNQNHPKDLEKSFKYLKDNHCDVIIAALHAGMEYRGTHGSMQDRYGNILYNLGAKIVVGNHSHVPEGVRVFKGVTQLYSLGNSSFGGNIGAADTKKRKHDAAHLSKSLGTVVAQFDLHFENGKYTGHQLTLWPIYISGSAPNNDYQPHLVNGDAAQKIIKKIQKDSKIRLKPYVDGKGAVQDFVAWPKK